MKKIKLLFLLLFLSGITFAQLSGNYFIPQGANPQGFATLAAAIDSVNDVGLSGTVYFYIDDNLAETGSLLKFYRGDLSATNNLIIKPAATKTPTITITGCVASGHNAYAGFTIDSTSYITIDGSNTIGGSSRDLTFIMNDGTNGREGILVFGNCDFITITNIKLRYNLVGSTSSGRGIYLNGQSTGAADNCTINNCEIGENLTTLVGPQHGIGFTGASTSSIYCNSGVISNNLIYANIRGINLFWHNGPSSTMNIFGNSISIMNPATGNVTWGILHQSYAGITNFNNNRIHSITQKSAATQGIYVFGTLNGTANSTTNIYNNFFGGDINHTGTGIPASVDVISFQDAPASAIVRLYYNTAVLNNMTKKASGRMTCLRFNPVTGSTFDIKNNIFVNQSDSAVAHALYFGGATTLFTSDNNDIYVTGADAKVGYYNTRELITLTDWQDSTGVDLNSWSVDPQLVSLTDFHFSSTGTPLLGKGIQLPGFTTDIDGELRDTIPEIGADEYPGIIPVELVSFSASVNENKVLLNWITASELNSSHFVIERRNKNTAWTSIGSVSAAGNSTSSISYSFIDEKVSSALVYYRLKQVDFDGSFSFSNPIEVITEIPSSFYLSQNYPNPFNPTTRINYTVPFDSKVTIAVYSITGELVTELVNGFVTAGMHSVEFVGSNLASGLYLYKMTAGDFTQSEKMMLIK